MKKKKVISIDVGNKNLHIVEGIYKNGVVEIKKQCYFTLPLDCVENGEIKKKEEVKTSIQKALSKNKIHRKDIILTIQSTKAIQKEFKVPALGKIELESMVKYEMKQYLPENDQEYVIEYIISEEFIEDNINKYIIRSAAIPEEIADGYFNILKSARLKPIALDLNTNSISKIFKGDIEINGKVIGEKSNIVLIDIGYVTTNVYLYVNRKIDFSRSIPLGGREINQSIAAYYNISNEEAEIKKIKELSFKKEDTWDDLEENIDSNDDLLSGETNKLINEIQKILQYFESRSDQNRINSIYLFGGEATVIEMPKHIEKAFNIPTYIINKIDKINFKSKSKEKNCHLYLNAVGAMIRNIGGDRI